MHCTCALFETTAHKFITETRSRCNFIFVIIKSHKILNHKLQHWSLYTSHDDFHYLIALIKFLFRWLLCNGYYELSLSPHGPIYTFCVYAEVTTWCNPLPSVNAHIFVQPANVLPIAVIHAYYYIEYVRPTEHSLQLNQRAVYPEV